MTNRDMEILEFCFNPCFNGTYSLTQVVSICAPGSSSF